MKFRPGLLLLLSSLFVSCVSLDTVSLTQIPKTRGKNVQAEVSRFIFLGFNFDNDYVDPLLDKLKDQCQGGRVQGILTKDETVNYFLMLLHTRRITAKGTCLASKE
jgi:hypothetical protein